MQCQDYNSIEKVSIIEICVKLESRYATSLLLGLAGILEKVMGKVSYSCDN